MRGERWGRVFVERKFCRGDLHRVPLRTRVSRERNLLGEQGKQLIHLGETSDGMLKRRGGLTGRGTAFTMSRIAMKTRRWTEIIDAKKRKDPFVREDNREN